MSCKLTLTTKVTLKEVREEYYGASGTASSIVRQLAIAGLAFVWVFSGGNGVTAQSVLRIPTNLLWVGLFLAITLALDLCQYLWRTAWLGIFGWHVERHSSDYAEAFEYPDWPNVVTIIWFVLKATTLILSYVVLAYVLAGRIR